jgi:hypothetical protein
MPDSTPIDWSALAEQLRSVRTDGGDVRTEIGSATLARAAVEQLIDPKRLATAVDHYVAMRPGFELARAILWLVHSWEAMRRCREIFASDFDLQRRRGAIELLRVVADRRALPWIEEFLADPDAEIQAWGIGIVDQLIRSNLADPEDCKSLLTLASRHENPRVREKALDITARIQDLPE